MKPTYLINIQTYTVLYLCINSSTKCLTCPACLVQSDSTVHPPFYYSTQTSSLLNTRAPCALFLKLSRPPTSKFSARLHFIFQSIVNFSASQHCLATYHTYTVNKVRELDIRGIVHHEFVPNGQTVNQVYYLEVLKKLREKVRRKRHELFANNSWILHHNNAPTRSHGTVCEGVFSY